MSDKKIICPKCGSDDVTEILYTKLPSNATSEWFAGMKERGIVLGGDIIFDDSPAYACRECDERFGNYREKIAGGNASGDSEDTQNSGIE